MMEQVNRKIIISQPIDDNLALYVIDRIMEVNDFDTQLTETIVGYEPEPIEIFINSGGGSATAGFAIIGAMEISKTPIFTYGLGVVASMALGIYITGDYRIASRYTRFMYHSVAYEIQGHIKEHEDAHKEISILQDNYNNLFVERTNIPKTVMDDVRHTKTDYFFSGAESVDLGISDIVTVMPERKIEVKLLDEEAEEVELEIDIEAEKTGKKTHGLKTKNKNTDGIW